MVLVLIETKQPIVALLIRALIKPHPGKDAVVLAAKNFGNLLQDIQIRSRFSSDHQIMLAYDLTLPLPIGQFRAAVLMDFTDELISKIEMFYDARPFEEMKTAIFSKK